MVLSSRSTRKTKVDPLWTIAKGGSAGLKILLLLLVLLVVSPLGGKGREEQGASEVQSARSSQEGEKNSTARTAHAAPAVVFPTTIFCQHLTLLVFLYYWDSKYTPSCTVTVLLQSWPDRCSSAYSTKSTNTSTSTARQAESAVANLQAVCAMLAVIRP